MAQILSEVLGKTGLHFVIYFPSVCQRNFQQGRQLDKRETLAYLEMKVFKPGHAKFIREYSLKGNV